MDSFLLLRRLVAAIVFKGQTVSDYWWSRRTIFLTQSDIRAFDIAGDWKATVLKVLEAEVWVETVTEGGRRFMAAWRKEEVDAARYCHKKR